MSELTHIHTDDIIVDADEHFVIDTVTRAITSESKKLTLMQYDHNSERYSFDINRIIDGHDLINCDRVQIHFVNIASNKQKHPGLYRVEDLHVNPDDENKLTFTWLVSNDATMYNGTLGFLVSFECTDGDKILYRWSSNAFSAIGITQGMDNDNTIMEMYADELLAWQNYMQTEFIPDLVDECYVERVFATAEEVAAVFDISNPDGTTSVVITPFEEITEYVDNAIANGVKVDNIYVADIKLNGVESLDTTTTTFYECTLDYNVLDAGIKDGTYKTAVLRVQDGYGNCYFPLIRDMFGLEEPMAFNSYTFGGDVTLSDLDMSSANYECGITINNSGEVSVTLKRTDVEESEGTEEPDTMAPSGGTKLYRHQLKTWNITYLELITSSNEIITAASLAEYLFSHGYTTNSLYLRTNYSIPSTATNSTSNTKCIRIDLGLYSEDGVNVYKCVEDIDTVNIAVYRSGSIFSGMMNSLRDDVSEI